MKKNNLILVGVVVVVVVAGVLYAVLHKSNKATTNTATTSSSSSTAVNNAVLLTKTDSSLGQYLAGSSGKPLYTYNADTSGVSNCTGACLANWPAYQDTGSTSNLPTGVSTIKRADNGQTQYTYNGLPLYYFISDSVGHVTGNGVDNFKVATPAAASSSSSSSTPSTSSSSTSSNSSSGYNY